MDISIKYGTKTDEEVTVMLALLDKDLKKMMLHCVKNQWKFEIIGSNNLELCIPKNSLHLLFYLGYQLSSGVKKNDL